MMMSRRQAISAIAIGVSAGAASASTTLAYGEPLLIVPFDLAACRERRGKSDVALVFMDPPQPVVTLDQESKYKSGTQSNEIDPKAEAAYKAKLKPIQDYTRGLTAIADSYATAKAPDLKVARVGVDWLSAWQKAGALKDARTEQSRAVICWELIPIAWSWWKLRESGAASDAERDAIDAWIADLRDIVLENYIQYPDRVSRNNNHIYWAGWSIMSVACVLQDRGGFNWGAAIFDKAMGQIGEDGALPLEMARGPRALHYHSFALAPLTMMAETMRLNARDEVFAEKTGAYRRLARVTLEGLAKPDWFAARSGSRQILSETLTSSQLAWLEPYRATTGDAAADPFLAAFRPMIAPRLGGDLTYYFAADA